MDRSAMPLIISPAVKIERLFNAIHSGDCRSIERLLREEYRSQINVYKQWGEIIRCILVMNRDSTYTEVLSAAADKYISLWTDKSEKYILDYRDWIEPLSRNFISFDTEGRGHSFLNFKYQDEISARLIDAAIDASLRWFPGRGEIVFLNTILSYYFKRVESEVSQDTLNGPPSFLPSRMRELIHSDQASHFTSKISPDILPKLRIVSSGGTLRDLVAEELMPLSFSETKKYAPGHLSPEQVSFLLNEFRDCLPKRQIQAYLDSIGAMVNEKMTLDTLSERVTAAKMAREFTPGIFVDCERALLSGSGASLNLNIQNAVLVNLHLGEQVTLITDGDLSSVTELLLEEGVDSRLLPISPKASYRGKLMEVLIDSIPHEYQGIGAVSALHPSRCSEYSDGTKLVKRGELWKWEK